MSDDLDDLRQRTLSALSFAAGYADVENLRIDVLGKSGELTSKLKELGKASPEERRTRGAKLNVLKNEIQGEIDAKKAELEAAALEARLARERIDVTLPPQPRPTGLIHPISRTMDEMAAIFGAMGFTVAEGPDIEDDWRNFSALDAFPNTHSPPFYNGATAHRTRLC